MVHSVHTGDLGVSPGAATRNRPSHAARATGTVGPVAGHGNREGARRVAGGRRRGHRPRPSVRAADLAGDLDPDLDPAASTTRSAR